MSIPNPFRPVCGAKKVTFLEEYLVPLENIHVPLSPTVSLADSLQFKTEVDVQFKGVYGGVIGLTSFETGGYVIQLQEWSNSIVWNNGTLNSVSFTYGLQLEEGGIYSVTMDSTGIKVNEYNLTGGQTALSTKTVEQFNTSNLYAYKKFKFSIGDVTRFEYVAAKVKGKRCLYDLVSGTTIDVIQ